MPWPDYVLLKTVTGTYTNSSGSPAKGRVTFTPTSTIVDDDSLIISTDTLTAQLNTAGSFSIELPATDNPRLSPRNWAYLVNVRLYGVKPSKYYIKIPYETGQPVDISDYTSLAVSPIEDATTQGSVIRGPVGPRGSGVLAGEGPPTSSVGTTGDIYIDTASGAYYGPKENGLWPAVPFYQIEGLTSRYVFTQASPASTWSITHPLGGFPSVTIVDSSGSVVVGDVSYNSNTSVVVSFSAPFSGNAYLT